MELDAPQFTVQEALVSAQDFAAHALRQAAIEIETAVSEDDFDTAAAAAAKGLQAIGQANEKRALIAGEFELTV